MNIGIFFKHARYGGGIYQYFLSLMDCIIENSGEDNFILFHSHDPEYFTDFRTAGIKTIKLNTKKHVSPDFDPKQDLDNHYEVFYKGKKVVFKTRSLTSELKIEAEKHNIELMLYPAPEHESFEVGIPYIMVIHDLAHRLLPEFEEFAGDSIYEQREYVFTNGIKDAYFILADSDVGREQIIENYGPEPDKIKALSFIPPPYLFKEGHENKREEVRAKYSLPEKFIFYPAQFWPHKNHENIIKALHYIKKSKQEEIPSVFVGSKQERWNNFSRMTHLAKDLEVDNQIIYLGYIEAESMSTLYEMAIALVMPTFLGPTNLPVLEAFVMGCPVITSNIRGVREQVGNAGILVTPDNHKEIADAIFKVWMDKNLARTLSLKGKERIASWGREKFCKTLREIVESAKRMLKDADQ